MREAPLNVGMMMDTELVSMEHPEREVVSWRIHAGTWRDEGGGKTCDHCIAMTATSCAAHA
jgi:hypothetical protein